MPDPRRWHALSTALIAAFITLLDVTIVAVAPPTIQRDLSASAAQVQWVVSGYALAYELALITAACSTQGNRAFIRRLWMHGGSQTRPHAPNSRLRAPSRGRDAGRAPDRSAFGA